MDGTEPALIMKVTQMASVYIYILMMYCVHNKYTLSPAWTNKATSGTYLSTLHAARSTI